MEISIRLIRSEYLEEAAEIVGNFNKKLDSQVVRDRFVRAFSYDTYLCFGIFDGDVLAGVCGAWISDRIYCGKQLELDNLVIAESHRSKGIGKILMEHLESYCKENEFESIELNTYVTNAGSHKFYFDNVYHILGFHFQKVL